MSPPLGLASAMLSVAVLLAGCSSQQHEGITVFAAASLQSTFSELGSQFEKDYPGTKVTFNFAGSADLVAQLKQGAPADVFASADTTNMIAAVDAGLTAGDPVNFASNTLTIVTPPGNSRKIANLADLAKPGTQLVVCAPQVPCGAATQKLEQATGVRLTPVSEESAVTDVLGKITSGQADAGLVYVTDAEEAGSGVETIPVAGSSSAVNTYPIAVLAESANPSPAHKFVELVTDPRGQTALTAAGFGSP